MGRLLGRTGHFGVSPYYPVGPECRLYHDYTLIPDAIDISIWVNNGTINGPAPQAIGLLFDGLDDTLNINTTFMNDLTAGSVYMWIKPTADGSGTPYACPTLFSNDSIYFGLQRGSTNKLAYYCYTGSTLYYESVATLPTNSWSLISVTWNAAGSSIYINGVFDSSNVITWEDAHVGHIDKIISLGNWQATNVFTGIIDRVLVFNSLKSSENISGFYNWSKARYL
jgi:hypothetical protein